MKDLGFVVFLWVGPPSQKVSKETLQQIKDAGFNLAMNYANEGIDPRTPASIDLFLKVAEDVGLDVLINDQRLHRNSNPQQIADVVRDWKNRNALYGYNVDDEPGPQDIPRSATVVKEVRKLDNLHLAYVNLNPNWGIGDYQKYYKYITDWVTTCDPQIISYDNYMFTLDSTSFFENLQAVREIAINHQKPFWNIILATAHGDKNLHYPPQSESQKRAQAMLSVAYGASGICWFTYWQPREMLDDDARNNTHFTGDAIVNWDGSKTSQFNEVQQINHDVRAIGDALLSSRSVGVFHNGADRPAAESDRWPSSGSAKVRVTNDAQVAAGLFEKDGHGYLMVVNRDVNNRSTATLWIGSGTTPIDRFDRPRRTWVSESHPTDGSSSQIAHLTTGLAPGDAALYRLTGGLPARSVDEIAGEVLFGQVRAHGGHLFLVNSADCPDPNSAHSTVYHHSVAPWDTSMPYYTLLNHLMDKDGFWLSVRNDLIHHSFYVGNVLNNGGHFYKVTLKGVESPSIQSWNYCPQGAKVLGRLMDMNGFWVCGSQRPEMSPEVLFGQVRNNGGHLYVVDSVDCPDPNSSITTARLSRVASWDTSLPGYTFLNRQLEVDGFWLCVRNDLLSRTFYVGNVVSNQGRFYEVTQTACTRMNDQVWNHCPGGAKVIGRLMDINGFWVCMK